MNFSTIKFSIIVFLSYLELCWSWNAQERRYHEVLLQQKHVWKELSAKELSEWYAPVDLCILKSMDRMKFPQSVRVDECVKYSKGSRKQFCGVGMGNNNYPCYGPFGTARPYFFKGVEGYSTAAATPILNFFAYLHLSKTTFLLLGDSTMRQKLQALQCEISRETNGQAKFYGNIFGILPCDTFLTIYFPSKNNRRFTYPSFSFGNKTYETHPLADQVITLYAISIGPQSVQCYQQILKDTQKTHMNPLKDYRLFSLAEEPDTILSAKRTELEGLYGNAARYTNELNLNQSRNVFILANMGLWYNLVSEYSEALPPVLQWLVAVGKRTTYRNVIAWHETLRQHWPNSYDQSGNFIKVEVEASEKIRSQVNYSTYPIDRFVSGLCCTQISNTSWTADWRNQLIQSLLEEVNVYPDFHKQITLLPLAEITRPLESMHTCSVYYRIDCTHYCFWPLLYQVFWHQLEALAGLRYGPGL